MEKLAAGSAGSGPVFAVGKDGHALEAAVSFADCLAAGGALCADGAAESCVFHVAAGKYGAVGTQKCSPDRKSGVGDVGAFEHIKSQIDQLTVADLRDTVAKVCTTYYTAKDCRTVLTNLFRLASADGFANKDLPGFIQLPSLTEKEREPFSDTEQANLWKLYEKGDIRAAVPLLMIYTGMMPGECFDLKVSMIDLENRQIVGAGKKTAVRKKTPITIAATIIPLLEDLIAHARPSGRLFCSSEDQWRADYYAALDAAGCRRLQPYSCRHTTASALAIDKNIAPQTIKKVMRWSTSKMLDRYAHPDTTDLQAAVDAIGSR